MKEKLTSRKFWVAIISIITGILGIMNCDDNIIVFVGSALTIIIPTVSYIIIEGKIDAGRVTSATQELLTLLNELIGQLSFKNEDTEENVNNVDVNNVKELKK